MKNSRTFLSLMSLLLAVGTPSVRAASGTWIADVDGLWSGTGNWAGGVVADGAGFTANFNSVNITANRLVTLDSARTLGTFLAGDTTLSQKYTFAGPGPLTFNNGGSSAVLNTFGGGQVQFDVPLILAENLAITKAGSGQLTIAGGMTGAGNITVNNNASGAVVFSSGTMINVAGTLASAGTGSGAVTVNSSLGASVTEVIQNAALSDLSIGGSNGTFSGSVTIQAGSVTVAAGTGLNAGNVVTLSSGGTFQPNVAAGLTIAGVQGSGGIVQGGAAAAARSLMVGGSGQYSFGGTIRNNGANAFSFTKAGSGTQTLTAANTYTGSTSVNAGTLVIGNAGSINGTSGVTVAGGGRLIYHNSTTALTAPLTLNGSGTSSRAVLGGNGTVAVDLALNNLGDTISPGNSPGILSLTANQNWSSNSYDWEVNNFAGTTEGTNFDQIQITGSLDLSGGSNSYMLNVISLTALNNPGDVPNFSNTTTSWTILTASTGITGFAQTDWMINTSAFTSIPGATGVWSISLNDTAGTDSLILTYTVPEPSTAVLSGLTAACLLYRIRRKARAC